MLREEIHGATYGIVFDGVGVTVSSGSPFLRTRIFTVNSIVSFSSGSYLYNPAVAAGTADDFLSEDRNFGGFLVLSKR